MARDPDEYVAPPAQSQYSTKVVNRALYWIRSQAHDLNRKSPRSRQKQMDKFQGSYDALQSLNLPIYCKSISNDKSTGLNTIECFKHPPLDTNPATTKRAKRRR